MTGGGGGVPKINNDLTGAECLTAVFASIVATFLGAVFLLALLLAMNLP